MTDIPALRSPKSAFESVFGRRLYESLPAVYRERDNPVFDAQWRVRDLGDLARLLDACGGLLDALRATLDQRLADAFPDAPTDGSAACQDWVLPYLARLLDVPLAASTVAGRRDEVAHALAWRQAKGTLVAAEQICESITRREAVLQEGWRRVATTPRVGDALLPRAMFGQPEAGSATDRLSERTRHPGLPAVTPDLRQPSQALRVARASASPGTPAPATQRSTLGGVAMDWRQAAPLGAPRHPGAYDDASRRTPDLRPPGPSQGLCHPRRLIAHVPPPWGLVQAPEVVAADAAALLALPHVTCTLDEDLAATPPATTLTLRNTSTRAVVLAGDLDLGSLPAAFRPAADRWVTLRLTGLRVAGTVRLTLHRLEAERLIATALQVDSPAPDLAGPQLAAMHCLFGSLAAPRGQVRLDRCTVRHTLQCTRLDAVDSLLAGAVQGPADDNGQPAAQPLAGEIRHCRVPAALQGVAALYLSDCTTEAPRFLASTADDPADAAYQVAADAAVLAPGTPQAIATGASDGGELGYFHGGRAGAPVRVSAAQRLTLDADAALRDLVFDGPVTVLAASRGALQLTDSVLRLLSVRTGVLLDPDGASRPVLRADGCLFGSLSVGSGLARLEYATVLGDADLAQVQASEVIFAGALLRGGARLRLAPGDGLRYCRVPPSKVLARERPLGPGCTTVPPLFHGADIAAALGGAPGCGVLHPACPAAVAAGAEDGGEMGAHHERRYTLTDEAVLAMLAEHLPVGLVPVLVPDPRMTVLPVAAGGAATQE